MVSTPCITSIVYTHGYHEYIHVSCAHCIMNTTSPSRSSAQSTLIPSREAITNSVIINGTVASDLSTTGLYIMAFFGFP